MKNGVVNIEVFEGLYNILKKYGKKDTEWAEATWGKKRDSSRISELKLLLDIRRAGKDDKTGRTFSVKKCIELVAGLKKLLGDEVVEKELVNLLKRAKTPMERNLLMVLMTPEKGQERLETVIKVVVLKEE